MLDCNYVYLTSTVVSKSHCANPDCQYHKTNKFSITRNMHIYRLNHVSLPFCSYNCRCDYIRKHGTYESVLLRKGDGRGET